MGNPSYCSRGFKEGEGVVKMFNVNGKKQILVAGYDALQTRIAAQALVRIDEFEDSLDTDDVTTSGESLDDVNIE